MQPENDGAPQDAARHVEKRAKITDTPRLWLGSRQARRSERVCHNNERVAESLDGGQNPPAPIWLPGFAGKSRRACKSYLLKTEVFP
jgi:hypothetical protein